MENQNQKKEGQYLQTFLTKNKGKMECYFAGVKHQIRTHQNNLDSGFVFQDCKKIDIIHPLGTVYLHKEYGYVCAGHFWYRFIYVDLVMLLN